jgi:hypothetical protein
MRMDWELNMSKVKTIETLAKALKKDLDKEGLRLYLEFNERMVENDIKYGRSPKRYLRYVWAARLALRMK